mmetsp:Transcript_22241/g.37743  ORF Transcript_22241/g.37743 Transcript_22241/m.37743 type:complete len:93 (-) Transcript_22241:3-281(-)
MQLEQSDTSSQDSTGVFFTQHISPAFFIKHSVVLLSLYSKLPHSATSCVPFDLQIPLKSAPQPTGATAESTILKKQFNIINIEKINIKEEDI